MERVQAPSQPQSTVSSPTLKLEAARCAKILLGCYRTGDANDPEVYVQSAISVLGEYPIEVMRSVCDPRFGLPAKSKWLPTMFEIKEACEDGMAPFYRRQREERLAQERKAALSAPPIHRMTREEMVEKYGPNWGLHPQEDDDMKGKRDARISQANDVLLRGEYQRAGVDVIEAAPGIPISMYLARKLKGFK